MDLLRHVSFFVAIADAGQIGVAAAELGLTQPPVSQGLQRLETELGVRLFDRTPRGVELTAAGRDLLPRARGMLESERGLRSAATARAGQQVALRVGFVPHIPVAAMATAALGCTGVVDGEVEVVTGASTALVKMVAAGSLDLAVIRHPAVLGSLVGGAVLRIPTIALVPSGHPAVARAAARSRTTRRPAIPVRSLTGLPVATPAREEEPAAYDLLMDSLTEHGLSSESVIAPDGRAALILVAMGRAIAFTVERNGDVENVIEQPLVGDPVPLRLRPVWRAEAVAPGVVDALMHRLRDELVP